jgi:glycosyltransferase involved in cell wall biosynthesis
MPRSFATSVPKVLMHNGNAYGGGQYRILQPAILLRQNGYAIVQAHPQLLDSPVLDILRPDALVVQFQQTDAQIEAMRRYRKTLKETFFVYEIDDLFWQVPDASVHKAGIPPDTKDRIKTAASICDAITVTTDRLAQEMRRLTGIKDVRVVPNDVPMQFINAALAGRRSAEIKSTKPRVGWCGGIGHTGDLRIVGEIMKILGDEVHWVFMGMVPEGVDPASVEFHAGVPFEKYAAGLGALRLAIALAPLEDNAFNRCKSDLRVLEYGAAGFPVIASDVPTYQDCPNIMRVKADPEAWAHEIRQLLLDQTTREHYAEGLHSWVLAKRCMDKNLPERVRAYLPRNTVIFDPIAAAPQAFPGPVVTVGADLPGLQNFPTFEAAWEAAPGANILYLRPDAAVNPLQFTRMIEALQPGHASVATLSNDSVYPTPQQFSAIDAPSAQKLDMAAALLGDDPVPTPCPTGPCILFSGSALSRYGLPTDRHYDDVEMAFMDWGARAAEGGRTHITIANTYIHAGTRINRTKEQVEWAVNRAVGWMPGLSVCPGSKRVVGVV